MSCLFCQIVEGKIPSNKVYEDEQFFAFRDIHPQAPTHILLVPKTHYSSLQDIPEAALPSVMGGLHHAIREIVTTAGIAESGYRTVINTGKWGGQTVFHLHLHILGGRQLGGSMVG